MKFPAWATPDHPVARREAALWQKTLRRWAWLLILFILLPCGCSAMCSLSSLPVALEANSPVLSMLIFGAWTVFVGIWLTASLWSWVLGTFVSVTSATLVARERESLNWSLLRLTALSVREVLAAKLAALGRLIVWPTVIVLGLETIGISLAALAGIVLIFEVGGSSSPPLPRDLQVALAGFIALLWLPAVGYFIVAHLVNLVYNTGVGLLSSTLARSTGTAVALSFVVNFGIVMFVFVPLQQVVSIGVQLLGGVLTVATQSPAAFFILTPLASLILPLVLQAAIASGTLYWAIRQSERIVE